MAKRQSTQKYEHHKQKWGGELQVLQKGKKVIIYY